MFSLSVISILFYISEWFIRLLMLVIVTRRAGSNTGSAMAWLLIIFFQPYVGAFFYLLFGEGRLPRKRMKQHEKIQSLLADDQQPFSGCPEMQPVDSGSLEDPARTLSQYNCAFPVLGGNSVQFLSKTDDVIRALIEDINAAKKSVHLLYYIFSADETGDRVMAALVSAASRGVCCRVIVDAVGSRPFLYACASKLRSQGVEVVAALPVNLFRRRLSRIDLRNHRKLAVVDGEVAYAGSQNIVHADYGTKNLTWYDLTLRITGPSVVELQTVFVKDWHFETGEKLPSSDQCTFVEPENKGDVRVQTVPSGPTDSIELYRHMVVAAIYEAREEVVITTPYFVPNVSLIEAISVAILRGVDVKVVLPKRVDQFLVSAAGRAYYDDLLNAGVSLYHFLPGLIHAKSMTIDKKVAFVGSANFDIRSFRLNFELNVILYGDEIAQRVRDKQQEYIDQSEIVLAELWASRSPSARFVQDVARLMSPML